jgi:uncharacterized protein YdaU (DUF1376 family)
MHYYQFNIGDYASHTQGLSLLEDIAYRRLIDQYYLSEKPPKGDCLEVSRSIGMREHSVEVCYVLEKFFVSKKNAWFHSRVEREIFEYKKGQKNKSKAGKASAEARKQKAIENTQENDQQVLSSVEQSLNNCAANHKPITNNHKPLTIVKEKTSQRFTPPTLSEVMAYCNERGNQVDPQRFINHYGANGWMRGKNKIKDWKACVRTWEQNDNQTTTVKPVETYESTVARLTDRSWAK